LAHRLALRDLVERPLGGRRPRRLFEDVRRARRARRLVVRLDQQPGVLAFTGAPMQAHQIPAPVQLLAVEPKRETAFAIARLRVAFRIPAAAVPDHHRAAAILALRDRALEGVVFDRVILDVNREPLLAWHEARAAGYRPALHDAAELEPQVVVQAARGVLLDDVAVASCGCDAAARFRRYVEAALVAVGLERHAARPLANGRLTFYIQQSKKRWPDYAVPAASWHPAPK